VKNISTTVLDGVDHVTVEFILEKNISDAVNDVRDAVARVKADLPAELRDPTVTKASTAGRVILTFTAAAAQTTGEPAMDAPGAELVRRQHRRQAPAGVPGVGAVKRVGGVYREVRVELDDARMAALRVSALDVSRQLRLAQKEAPGGRGDVSGAEQSVRTIGTVQTAAELAAWTCRCRTDATCASTRSPPSPTPSPSRAPSPLQDGKPVVGFEIFRTKGASEVAVAKGARAAIEELQKKHPKVVLRPGHRQRLRRSRKTSTGSMELLYEGARWRCWWCGGSCATGAPRWWPPPRCRCR
jgi:multidrug efflux pump subunit AcrB